MRTITGQYGVTFQVPDELCFAFNPVLFIVEDCEYLNVQAAYDGETYTLHYDGGNKIYGDAQQVCQRFFFFFYFSLDYSQGMTDTGLGKEITFTLTALKNGETRASVVIITSFVIWGAKRWGKDTFNGFRVVKMWEGYPFTFGLYAKGGGTLLVASGQAPRTPVEITEDGMLAISSSIFPDDADFVTLYDYAGTLQQGVFDGTFDLTFYMWQNVAQTLLARIDIDRCPNEDGVYLRWIDRHGFWCYWLFDNRQEQRTTNAVQDFTRPNLQGYTPEFGYQRGAGRRAAYTRGGVLPLAATLVDETLYDYLFDVASSPVVDMYLGKDENDVEQWIGVQVQAGTFARTDQPLQDFVINLVLPTYNVQRL